MPSLKPELCAAINTGVRRSVEPESVRQRRIRRLAATEAGIRCRVERSPEPGENLYWITREDKEIISGPYPQAKWPDRYDKIGIDAQIAIHEGETPPPTMEGGPTRPAGPLENIVCKDDIVWTPPGWKRS